VRGPQSASCNFQLSIPQVPPFPIGVRFPIGIEYPGDDNFDGCSDGHHLLITGCFEVNADEDKCMKSVGVNSKDKAKLDAKGVIGALVECGGDKATPSPAGKQELCIVDGQYSTTLNLTLQGLTGAQFLKLAAAITDRDVKKFPALKFIKDAPKKYNSGELTLILSSLSDINKLLKGKKTSIEAGGARIIEAAAKKNSRPRAVTTFSAGKLSAKVPVGTIAEKSVKVPKETRQLLSILKRGGITGVQVTVKFSAKRTDTPKKKVKSSSTFTVSLED
jgi:hypothetical protein